MESMTRKQAVYTFMKRNRKYISGRIINEVGGKDGLRRLRELRAEGVPITSRKNKDGSWEYKLGK